MSEPHYSINPDGVQKLERWTHAVAALERAKSDLNKAEVEFANSKNELGKFMTPNDAVIGETFNLAVGDGFLAVRFNPNRDYDVGWRTVPSPRHQPH